MPTKMNTCCKEKAVLVTVYVERPRRRKVASKQHQRHHHLHHHHHHHLHLRQPIRQEVIHNKHGGYNRRAELLHYSQHLRESARSSAASTPSHNPKPISSNSLLQPQSQIIALQRKPKYGRTPACLGNWRVFIPDFFRSLTSLQAKKDRKKKKKSNGSTRKKIKAIVKSIQVQKKWGFVSRMFAALKKHR